MRPVLTAGLVSALLGSGCETARRTRDSESAAPPAAHAPAVTAVRKLSDVVVYRDDRFYCAFPSVVVRPDGEILCAFRRAPNRMRLWGEPQYRHTDADSHLVLVRSKDGGATWTAAPELILAHPFGGSQDPCMLRLRDGSILCMSYGWALLPPQAAQKLDAARLPRCDEYGCLGGYVMRSDDGGRNWLGPFVPPAVPGEYTRDVFGKPTPMCNRGAPLQRADGTVCWAVVRGERMKPNLLTSVHLAISPDRGETWTYACPIAADDRITFNEASLVETTKGEIVAFLRTEDFGDHLAVARSVDGGKSFRPWQDGKIVGHPYQALRLKDGRILLVYGYRHPPFGIRARLLDPDGSNAAEAPEIVLRDDGVGGDLGYPWSVQLPDGRIFVAYYMDPGGNARYIAGSLLTLSR